MNIKLKEFLYLILISVSSSGFAVDTDRDTLPDDWETANGRDPLVADYIVSAGGQITCALDDTGVVCWRPRDRFVDDKMTVPILSNPTQISVGLWSVCAIDDTGLVCWGNSFGVIPTLSNPTQVSLGYNHGCVLDDTGVVCWGDNFMGQTTVPVLSNPTQVTAGFKLSCALDDSGVVCWGNDTGYHETTIPTLSNPTQVSTRERLSPANCNSL